MGRIHRLISFSVSLLVMMLATHSSATQKIEKMDNQTHTLVINKLESVLKNLNARDVNRVNVLIRLGDLHSERARLQAMAESESCQGDCHQARNDRRKALGYYEEALPHAKPQDRDSVILQMTHLYELTEQKQKAVALYERSIAEGTKKHSTAFLAQAHTGLGEIAYRDGRVADAIRHLEKALSFKDCPKRGLVTYRLAWSYLNSGAQKKGVDTLVKILKTEKLQQRESSDGEQVDTSFIEDVSRDLATFLARGTVGAPEAKLLRDLSPKTVAQENLSYLGTEADRLGNKKAALYVYKSSLAMDLTSLQRQEMLIRIAQVELDLGHEKRAITELEKAVQHWKKNGCKNEKPEEDQCKELQGKMRQMVVDWDRRSRKKYQPELLEAYALYNSLFNTDTETHYWAGVVARNLKNTKLGVEFFHKASLLAADDIEQKRDKKNLKAMFEGSLLGEIELAELSKDLNTRESAYVHYLKMNPKGERHMEVRYQKAHVAFERKQYAEAAPQFYDVALKHEKKPESLRATAADLAIDSLVFLKDDERIESWANEFAHAFPAKRNEFGKVSRTATLKLVAKTVADKRSSSSDVSASLKRLKAINLSGASYEDQVSFYKTRLILAERNQDLAESDRAANDLLKVKGLTDADEDYALGRKAWAAESRLDFKQALKISQKMQFKNLSQNERILRLAMLSELAGLNAKSYYEQSLKLQRGKSGNAVRVKLIRASKNGWAELKRHEADLKRSPDLLAGVVLDLYLKTGHRAKAESYASRQVMATPQGNSLGRMFWLADYQGLNQKLARHRMPSRGDKVIQKALVDRLNLIRQAEGMAEHAVQSGDWSLQTLSLSLLGRENKRLHGEIVNLPVPAQIKGAQRTAYLEAVQRQAQPYLTKSEEIEKKLVEFWREPKALDALISDAQKARPEARRFAVTEMRLLSDISGQRGRWLLNRGLEKLREKPSNADLAKARNQLRQNPFDTDAVQNLKSLEEQSGGSETMVVYLEARLAHLQGAGA